MQSSEFCELVGLLKLYLDRHPQDGAEFVRVFLEDDKILMNTEDVARVTGWSPSHVRRLCSQSLLPYIPGSPNKFLLRELRIALQEMQVGGIYGRRKSRAKGPKKK